MQPDTLLAALGDGSLGFVWKPYDGLQRVDAIPGTLAFQDTTAPLRTLVTVSFCSFRVSLDAESFPQLHAEAKRHARDLHDALSARLAAHKGEKPPETSPAEGWSPLVSCELVEASPRRLRVIHRRRQAPGEEMVAGHLVLPARNGTVELQVAVGSKMTGMRTALATLQALKGVEGPPTREKLEALLPKINEKADGRALDKVGDALAVTRARLDRVAAALEGAGVAAPEPGPVSVPGLGCRFEPPPRFVFHKSDQVHAQCARIGFTISTEGLALLTVIPLRAQASSDADKQHENLGTQLIEKFVPPFVTSPRIDSRRARSAEVETELFTSFTLPSGFSSTLALRIFPDAKRRLWSMLLSASGSAPVDELFAILQEARAGFALLEPGTGGSGPQDPAPKPGLWGRLKGMFGG